MNRRVKHPTRLRAIAIIFVVALIFAFILIGISIWEKKLPVPDNGDETRENTGDDAPYGAFFYEGEWYREKDNLETVLLIGVDKYDNQITIDENDFMNQQQSDFLLLLLIDRKNHTYCGIQINRDTMAPVKQLGLGGKLIGTKTEQIAMSHTYGSGGKDSCRNTVDAVSELLYGIKIDHYAAVTMDAVSELTDLVGGVPVTVQADFSGVSDTLKQGETVLLDGSLALTYVRARSSMKDNTNISRMERQHQFLLALLERMRSKMQADTGFALECIVKISESLTSDCTNQKLADLLTMTDEYEMGDLIGIKGTAELGDVYMEFHVDEEALKTQIMDLFYEKVPQAAS